jgi:hypothetical protein
VSFRRFVGKYVRITMLYQGGGVTQLLAKLSSYDDSGIWIDSATPVNLPDRSSQTFKGLLFIPMSQIINVFGCEDLDGVIQALNEKGEGV